MRYFSHAALALIFGALPLCFPDLANAGKSASTSAADQSEDESPVESIKNRVPVYTSVRPLPENVTLAELDNGLTVIVQENHFAPVATVRCTVKNTGSAFEGKYLGAGLSHVLEHVVAGGTTSKRSEKEISKIIEGFGGATNAFTSNDRTTFFVDCPAHDTMTAIDLVADSMQHVVFEPKEFARELKVVRRELADGEVERERVLDKLLNQTVYAVHPIRHPVIGYLPVLNGTTNQAIIDFYHERYVPNNQIFVVVGDVKARDVLDQVARQWTGTPRGRETYVPMTDEPDQLSPRETFQEMDGTSYDMAFAWPTVELSDKDLYALDLAAYILGEGDSSRLVQKLKHDRRLVESVSATSSTPHYVRGYFAIAASCRPETWHEAGDNILREVERLQTDLVEPAELAKAKKQKASELVYQHQTVQQQADALADSFLSAIDPLFDRGYTERIQKVTAEEIRDVARRYLMPGRLNRIVITPPGGTPKLLEAEARQNTEPARLVTLKNGLRVIVKRQANLPLVSMGAYVLAGSLVDNEKQAGRTALVAEMLCRGTGDQTARDIADYFDSIGGTIAAAGGRFSIDVTASCLRDDFPKAFSLFAASFTRPGFPQREFDEVRAQALAAIARRSDDPQSEVLDAFYDLLPATSPYHINPEGSDTSLNALTADDLKQYHARYFIPSRLVVTVFGDIRPDEAVALVEKHFENVPPSGIVKELDIKGDNAIKENKEVHKSTNKDTAMVLFGFPCEGIMEKQDHAAMTVLRTILNGYRYPSGWLHTELRGAGLVYYVQSFETTGPLPGFYCILSQTSPDKSGEVVKRIRANLARARSGDIPVDEFENAVKQIVALHAQENTTIGEQSGVAAMNELMGLGYQYDASFDERIRAVKLADLTRMAKKVFEHGVLVVCSPVTARAAAAK